MRKRLKRVKNIRNAGERRHGEEKGVMEREMERFKRFMDCCSRRAGVREHGNMLAVLPGCLCSVFRESS